MMKEMRMEELEVVNGGGNTMSADGGGSSINNAFTPKYGDLRDVPSAVAQAVSNCAKTIATDKEFQQAAKGVAQITYGVIKNKPGSIGQGWDNIRKASGN